MISEGEPHGKDLANNKDSPDIAKVLRARHLPALLNTTIMEAGV